jgi:hypothetical protein
MVNCHINIGSVCCVLCVPGFKGGKWTGQQSRACWVSDGAWSNALSAVDSMCCVLCVAGFKEWKVDRQQ